jgi:hypothetical protein
MNFSGKNAKKTTNVKSFKMVSQGAPGITANFNFAIITQSLSVG